MSVTFVKQDLTTSDANYICHQVNCRGAMNSGVAKAIREKWPIVYGTYSEYYKKAMIKEELLGKILVVNLADYGPDSWPPCPAIINMFAQESYGYDGKRYTSYDAFWSCLGHIREAVPKGSKIAFPYKIGCDRGGANWPVILTMILSVLEDDYDIEFSYLEEDTWLLRYIMDTDWEGK